MRVLKSQFLGDGPVPFIVSLLRCWVVAIQEGYLLYL